MKDKFMMIGVKLKTHTAIRILAKEKDISIVNLMSQTFDLKDKYHEYTCENCSGVYMRYEGMEEDKNICFHCKSKVNVIYKD